MAIYTANIHRYDTKEKLNIGTSSTATKMNMFRFMQANGEKVVSLFADCGEFEFIWKKSAKVWEFFNEAGEKVGSAKYERDTSAEYAAKVRYFKEAEAAYNAGK